ncbi:MAG: L-seryl-tRNA(Sec) selenium transferase [candidate division Zixibacteria bacterium]|nr:L-seryl-tRNA(Sec) selenium transferase [candidate division Zixibacteria bacterium]
MTEKQIKHRRDLPAIEELANDPAVVEAGAALARPLVVDTLREAVDACRGKMETGKQILTYADIVRDAVAALATVTASRISRVINGTGILVHTNLGRAPLSETLFENIKKHITGYGNVEFDIPSGKRGKRGVLAERYLAMLSTAEAGTVVNNNAAALFMILHTYARRRKVIISRGELVQIGGGFRIPDIIRNAGAKLLEIGTSNITTRDDYRTALAENPALILKVHRSNFSVTGFTEEVDLKSLVDLGTEAGIPVINDLGSGVFIDTSEFIGVKEPTVQSSVRDGAALTCFSGDKLLGGMQAGLIVGRREMIDKIKKNPVFRAMRVDKTIFSTLEELLGFYLDGTWRENIKLWRLANTKEAELYEKGRRMIEAIGGGDRIILEGSHGRMGGGSLPEIALPSVALVFAGKLSARHLATLFRKTIPPIIGRISEDRFLIDLKAIDREDEPILISHIKEIIKSL